MPVALSNGIDIYYETAGEGEPLVLIPGMGGTVESWRAQIRYFQRRYRVLSFDNRGSGRSSMPPGPYSMDQLADDLAGLLDALGIHEPVRLVGASMGGLVAQCFIYHYPQRVKQLALVCTGVSGGDPRVTFPSWSVMQQLAFPGITPAQRLQTLFDVFYHPAYLARHPEVFAEAVALYERIGIQPMHATHAQLQAAQDTRPYYKWLSRITVPVWIAHGANDQAWPVQNAYTLAKGVGERAELVIFEEAGHMVFQEQAPQFNARLEAFFERA